MSQPDATPADPSSVVIIGAGPAGLTAAYQLAKRGVTATILEADDIVGGISRTVERDGWRFDIGGHRFFTKVKEVDDLWFEILGPEEFLQRPRMSRILYRGKLYDYPLKPVNALRNLGPVEAVRCVGSYAWVKVRPPEDTSNLEGFYVSQFGWRLYEHFFRRYNEKVWGVPTKEMSADFGAQRSKGMSLMTAIVESLTPKAVKARRGKGEQVTSLIESFNYPKYGPGQMWETVAREVTKGGGEIRFGQRIVGVYTENGRVKEVEVEDQATRTRQRVACDYFFSTMPVKELVKQTSPQPPAEVREVAEGLQYRDFLTVGLLLKKLHVEVKGQQPATRVQDNWIYVQDGGVQVGRIQVFNNWSPYMVADRQNTVWIGLEYFVSQGDVLWRTPDENLVKLGTIELERIGFIRKEDVLDGCVLRMPKAYPAYFGTYDRLGVVQEWAAGIPNLFLIGRNGMHRYNNQDHSMLTAMMAVDNILEGRTDQRNLWEVNLDMVYHEEKGA